MKPQIAPITLIFCQLQIKLIWRKFIMRKRMNWHGLAGARKEFTPNLLGKFTPHLLSHALAEYDFFEPLIAQITLILNKLQILQITQMNFECPFDASTGSAT